MKLITKLCNLKWYKALPIWFIIMTLFVFGLYKLILIGADLSKDPIFGSDLVLMKISLILAIPFSLLIVLLQDQMNKSIAFWDRAEVVEKEIDDAETLDELNRIVVEEFFHETGTLKKMASGPPHYQKMREMYKVIETKARYLK